MSDTEKIFGIIASLAVAFSLGPILLKLVRSKKENAETDATAAEADQTHVASAKQLVDMLNKQTVLMSKDVELLKSKVKTLEEEGRLNLIWFSELTEWARSAYKRLLAVDPDYAAPPEAPWVGKKTTTIESARTTITQEGANNG